MLPFRPELLAQAKPAYVVPKSMPVKIGGLVGSVRVGRVYWARGLKVLDGIGTGERDLGRDSDDDDGAHGGGGGGGDLGGPFLRSKSILI